MNDALVKELEYAACGQGPDAENTLYWRARNEILALASQGDRGGEREALKWIVKIANAEYEQDHKLRADGARTLKRIAEKAEAALEAHPPSAAVDEGAEITRLKAVIERDRTFVAGVLPAIRAAIKSREWLRLGRGSYEWNDARWKDEFGQALDEIQAAFEPLTAMAADLTDSPKTRAAVLAARATPSPVVGAGVTDEMVEAACRRYHACWDMIGDGSGTPKADARVLMRATLEAPLSATPPAPQGVRIDAMVQAADSEYSTIYLELAAKYPGQHFQLTTANIRRILEAALRRVPATEPSEMALSSPKVTLVGEGEMRKILAAELTKVGLPFQGNALLDSDLHVGNDFTAKELTAIFAFGAELQRRIASQRSEATAVADGVGK